jgi:hypothetical protein
MTLGLLLAAGDGLGRGLLLQAGGAAGLFAIIAMILVVPLYVTQRREVKRLLRWKELEPERGDDGAPAPAPVAPATAAAPATASYPATPRPTGGYMSPAERVTADRPALSRITAERAAIQSPSFWRRLLARGPRHPLVLSLIAIFVAALVVVAVGLLSGGLSVDTGDSPGGSDAFDRAEVPVVVLNASGTAGLADRVADDVAAAGFENVRTGATGSSSQTVVLYDKGQKREAGAVARELGVEVLQPIDRESRSIAPEAAVVIVAGEDRARA